MVRLKTDLYKVKDVDLLLNNTMEFIRKFYDIPMSKKNHQLTVVLKPSKDVQFTEDFRREILKDITLEDFLRKNTGVPSMSLLNIHGKFLKPYYPCLRFFVARDNKEEFNIYTVDPGKVGFDYYFLGLNVFMLRRHIRDGMSFAGAVNTYIL